MSNETKPLITNRTKKLAGLLALVGSFYVGSQNPPSQPLICEVYANPTPYQSFVIKGECDDIMDLYAPILTTPLYQTPKQQEEGIRG